MLSICRGAARIEYCDQLNKPQLKCYAMLVKIALLVHDWDEMLTVKKTSDAPSTQIRGVD